MATIHMNVDSCRNMQNTINTTHENLMQQVATLNSNVVSTVGSEWIAPSATQFQSTFQEWSNTMKQLLEQLSALNQRLATEINEFEAAAASLQ